MKYVYISTALLFLFACENPRFDKDKRQIAAKDVIRRSVGRARGFDVTAFREDTLDSWTDTLLKRPIQYTLNYQYIDSAGILRYKRGEVVFTPDGRSIMASRTVDLQSAPGNPAGGADNSQD